MSPETLSPETPDNRNDRMARCAAEGRKNAAMMARAIGFGSELEQSAIVDIEKDLQPGDVSLLYRYLQHLAPMRRDNAMLYGHLLATAEVAGHMAEKLGRNPSHFKAAGLLHDAGRFFTHRYYRHELLADILSRHLKVRPDLQAMQLPSNAFLGPEAPYASVEELTPEQRILTLADICGKFNLATGTLLPFADILRFHRASRQKTGYAAAYGQEEIWPSELHARERRTPEFVEGWAQFYEALAAWYAQESGESVDDLRETIDWQHKTGPIDTVIFDIGNVLVTNPDPALMANQGNILGIPPRQLEELWQKHVPAMQTSTEHDPRQFWSAFCSDAGVALPEDYGTLWTDGMDTTPFPETQDVLMHLKAHDYTLVALTDTIPPHQAALRERGVFAAFNAVVTSPETGLTKKQATHTDLQGSSRNDAYTPWWIAYFRGAEKALEQGRSALERRAIFIDDKAEYVTRAKEIGIDGIVFDPTKPDQLQTSLMAKGIDIS